jgi:hypothetical protein
VLPLMPDLHFAKGDLKRRGTACAIEGVTFGRLSRCACRRVPLRPLTQWVRPFAGSGQFDYEAHRCSAHGTQLLIRAAHTTRTGCLPTSNCRDLITAARLPASYDNVVVTAAS